MPQESQGESLLLFCGWFACLLPRYDTAESIKRRSMHILVVNPPLAHLTVQPILRLSVLDIYMTTINA